MIDRVRLLICEDSDDDALLVVTHLRRGGLQVDYERVQTAQDAAEALARRPPDLVISDYAMPGFSAEEALALLRDSGLEVPFILVSGRVGEESAVALMRAGAHDFILKEETARLVPAVRRELMNARSRRQRREAEEALRLSEERYRLLAQRLPDALFRIRLDPDPEVEFVSDAVFCILGVEPEYLQGDPRKLLSLVAPDDRSTLKDSWAAPDPGPTVIRWLRPDGGDRWTEQRIVAIRDPDGRMIAVEGMLRDITERVQAEDRRKQLEQQLRQTERLDSLGRLAGGIAHDFNNLLAVVLGRADLMLAELPGDHALRDDLGIIREVAERGAALTRRILVFSRQERLRPETLDVNDIVTVTKEVLSGAVGEDVEFVTDLGQGLPPVEIDRSELERLLLNLVVNSRKAMPDGGRLIIRTEAVQGTADARPMVRVSVTDTGVGMSESVLEHAFEPYFTTDAATGTGLGLSSAYGVVKAAGGAISLSSELGVGTTVEITLPTVEHAAQVSAVTPSEPARGAGRTILLVEDDDDVRDLVALMLRQSGYEVVEAASPDKALVLLDVAREKVDLLLSDVVMAGMSGIQLAQAVRDARPGTPVLLMSGYTAGTLPGDATLPPGVSLIRKPFTTTALLRAAEQALSGAS